MFTCFSDLYKCINSFLLKKYQNWLFAGNIIPLPYLKNILDMYFVTRTDVDFLCETVERRNVIVRTNESKCLRIFCVAPMSVFVYN